MESCIASRTSREAVQRRLDEHPEKMRQRRGTVEHPFGTIKARMGATHFLMKILRARPYRGESPEPGKDVHGELELRPGIREQPGSI